MKFDPEPRETDKGVAAWDIRLYVGCNMGSLFQLPDELLYTTLAAAFPSRDSQIRALVTLLSVSLTMRCLSALRQVR